jgi:hypothetical protein
MKRILFATLISLLSLSVYSQGTVTTVPPLISNNGQSGITCNLSATGVDIVIDSLSYYLGSGSSSVELWYNTTAINGSPGSISVGNGWTSLGTWTATGSGSGLSPVGGGINLTIPAGQTYGFCVGINSGPSLRYMTYAGGQTTFTDGTLTIETGPNVGYGGYPSPSFTVRQFLGAVTYDLGIRGTYDGSASNLRTTSTQAITDFDGYREIPFGQGPSFEFEAKAANRGDSTITGIDVEVNVLGTSLVDSFLVDTLLRSEDTIVVFPNNIFTPTAAGTYTAEAVISIAETDTVPDNDTAMTQIIISDTVLARDDSTAAQGIGGTGVIEFGHMFEVWQADTLSTVSFYLNSPTVGSQLRMRLYTFSDTALSGNPGPHMLIDSSRVFTVDNSSPDWYSIEIGCGGRVLQPGKYFISVVQINPNNMGIGYTGYKATPDTFFYLDFYDGIGFRDAYHTSVNPLVQSITLLLRTNFGRVGERAVLDDSLSICFDGTGSILTEQEFEFYTWSTGSLFDSIVVGSAGFYSVSVTDDIGCTYEDSIYVDVLPQISFTASSNSATCGLSDGSATATGSGNYAPYTYEWSTGTSGSSISMVPGDVYEVTVTDDLGCERVESVTVLGANPTVAGSFGYPTCAGDADGSASVSVVTGIPSYSYAWGTGGSADTESGLSAGSYTVTVTDSSNCSATITIDVMDPDTLNLSTGSSSNPSFCGANDGVAAVTATGGIGPYTYIWSNGQNSSSAINLGTGTFDVTVTDANNCVRTETVTLIDPLAPTLTSSGSTVDCSYDLGSVSVSIAGGSAPFLVLWDNGSTDSSQTGLAVGVYNVVVTDAQGCVKATSASVDGPDALGVSFMQGNITGQGKADISAMVSGATPPYTYQWRADSGSTNHDIVGETDTIYADAPNGIYWLVVTDANGCVDSATVQVAVETGLIEFGDNFKMDVYPNPTADKFNVRVDTEGELKILTYDVRGKVVYSELVKDYAGKEREFDFSELSNGLYLMTIQHKNGTSFAKIQLNR